MSGRVITKNDMQVRKKQCIYLCHRSFCIKWTKC